MSTTLILLALGVGIFILGAVVGAPLGIAFWRKAVKVAAADAASLRADVLGTEARMTTLAREAVAAVQADLGKKPLITAVGSLTTGPAAAPPAPLPAPTPAIIPAPAVVVPAPDPVLSAGAQALAIINAQAAPAASVPAP